MSKDNGGPAFPVSGMQHDGGFHGMTLRDYFAAKAMPEFNWGAGRNPECAKAAYEAADAMLAARGES